MSENKRPDTQGWDTEAVRRRIISEVDAGAETGSKKKKHRKFNWKIYIAAVVLGSMLLAGLGWILANDLCALDKGNDTYTVTIEEGDGVFKIASKLKKAGLIELKGFFVLYEIFTGAKFTLSALQAGTVALALNCGAYMAEIIRAGIQSVDPGQMEAARSLGLPYWRAMVRVVLPQAIRTMIPSIINQFIITLKDTSILSVIGFPELVNTAKNVVANTWRAFEVWAIVGIMYLIVITLLSRLAKRLERRLNRGRE